MAGPRAAAGLNVCDEVPNVKTAQPYNGNFLEFTVVDVALKQ